MDGWMEELTATGLRRYGDENRRILSELSQGGAGFEQALRSGASPEAILIAVAAMIEENNKALLSELS